MAGGGGVGHGAADDKEYPGNLTTYVIVTCVVASMGGLIFGYDIGISGGVTSMDSFLMKFFPSVLRKTEDSSGSLYCKFDSHIISLFTSSLYLAALLSSLLASTVSTNFGRKRSMLFGGLHFFVGAFICAFAQAVWMLIVGRIFLGFGVGYAIQAVPLYLSEMSPYKYRGALNIGFQLCITIGILVANLVNYVVVRIGDGWGWRLSLGGAIIPALILTVGSLLLPETPNSMIERGKHDQARAMLKRIRGLADVDEEFNDIVSASVASKQVEYPWRTLLLERKYRYHLTMAIAIPLFQQLAGINAIVFYAPLFFNMMGFEGNASLMSTVITGGVNILATAVSIYGVDKWGRRFLFLEGGIQMLICLIVVAISLAVRFGVDGNPGELPRWFAFELVLLICIYVSGFAWSWGPLGWLIPSEIFPLEIRSAAQSMSASVNMGCTFLMAQIFLTMLCHLKFGLFLFFAFFVLVMTVFIYYALPETKNIPIEEMSIQISFARVLL